jgi:hypothetical protein
VTRGGSSTPHGGLSGDGRHYAFTSNADNLDGTANGLFARRHDPDADGDGAIDPGISLNAADGDALDTALRVYDPSTAQPRPAAQVPASFVAVHTARAAVLTPEAEDGGLDRNLDGDDLDSVAQVYDGLANTLTNLGVAAEEVAISHQVVCFSISEAAHGAVDRSGDGVANDRVLGVWTIGTPAGSLAITPYTVTSLGGYPAVGAAGNRCVFQSREASEGVAGVDLNGDLDTADTVLRVRDGAGAHDLFAARDFVIGDTAEYVAARSCESEEGSAPLNGDGDAPAPPLPPECVMQVVDLTGPAPTARNTGRAASLCTFPGCDPFFEPYRVRRGTISFLSRESEQSGPSPGVGCPAGSPGVCDLTGDGDALDLVIQVYSVRAEEVQSFEIQESHPPQDTAPFPEGSIDDQTVLHLQVPECTACKIEGQDPCVLPAPSVCPDLNGDGAVDDALVLLLVGDVDEDGTLDDAENAPDNCGEAANPAQTDADLDRLGDFACDPSPFSFTTGATVCDVDGNGRIDQTDVATVFAARGQAVAFPPDLRDADGDAVVTVLDSAACADRCTYADCATAPPPPPPSGGCGLLGIEWLPLWLLARRRARG